MIKKERDLYDSQIKQLQGEKQLYNQNNQLLQYKFKRLHDNTEEYQSIFNYDKELFFNLNFLINVPTNLEKKLQDLNHNFSLFSRQKYSKRRNVENLIHVESNKSAENKHFCISNFIWKISLPSKLTEY